LITGRLITAY